MMRNAIVPFFSEKSCTVIVHSHIKTTGIGETALADIIRVIEDNVPDGTSLAYLPHAAGVNLRVSSIGIDKEVVDKDNRKVVEAIAEAAEEFFWCQED